MLFFEYPNSSTLIRMRKNESNKYSKRSFEHNYRVEEEVASPSYTSLLLFNRTRRIERIISNYAVPLLSLRQRGSARSNQLRANMECEAVRFDFL